MFHGCLYRRGEAANERAALAEEFRRLQGAFVFELKGFLELTAHFKVEGGIRIKLFLEVMERAMDIATREQLQQ